MSRIRTLKPEWATDEKMFDLSDRARMVSAGLIVLADDYGNLSGHPAVVGASLWPTRDDGAERARGALEELEAANYIRRERVQRKTVIHICGWFEHQKIDHPGKPRFPVSESVLQEIMQLGKSRQAKFLEALSKHDVTPAPGESLALDSRKSRESLATDPGPVPRTLDLDPPQSPPGGLSLAPVEVSPPKPKRASKPPKKKPERAAWFFAMATARERDEVEAVIACYVEHHPKAKPGDLERGLIVERLREGLSSEDLCDAIDGLHRSEFHVSNGHTALELVMRDRAKVESFRRKLEASNANGGAMIRQDGKVSSVQRLYREAHRARKQELQAQLVIASRGDPPAEPGTVYALPEPEEDSP